MVTKTELRRMDTARPRVVKEMDRVYGYPWTVQRGKDRTIVSVWPDWQSARDAANAMAGAPTGFHLAV